jgi:lysophospholipase L1-like esterase
MRIINGLTRNKWAGIAVILLLAPVAWYSFPILRGLVPEAQSARQSAAPPGVERFARRIENFQVWDTRNSPPQNGILFVGSSTIAGWSTASAFPGQAVINRGLGGSNVSDINYYYEQVVKPYSPAVIVFYAGDNDISGGKTPARVLADFKTFVNRVRMDFDKTRILFVSIKPSLARWEQWPRMAEANDLVRHYTDKHSYLTYVDLAGQLLDESGQPKDVFVEDGLHMNDEGYQLLVAILKPYLEDSLPDRIIAAGHL